MDEFVKNLDPSVRRLVKEALLLEAGRLEPPARMEAELVESGEYDLRTGLKEIIAEAISESAEQPDDGAYVPIGKLWGEHFDNYKQARRFVDSHPKIRTNKPSPQRLEVHAGDWARAIASEKDADDDDDNDAFAAGYDRRVSEEGE